MMASLRARLLVAVLALTACGLLLVGGVTYAEQRSFQYDRVDQQLRASILGVAHQLDQETGGERWARPILPGGTPRSIGVAAAAPTSAYRPGPTARSATPAAACSPPSPSRSTAR